MIILFSVLAGIAAGDDASPEDRALDPRRGYLAPSARPDGLALVPPPPQPDSAAFAHDQELLARHLALRGTPRWELATQDADLSFPAAAGAFACALGVPITAERTPTLYAMLRRTLADAGLATYPAKDHYRRPRPFLVNGEPICTPDSRESLTRNHAYPSGHAAVGYAWALILAELAPDHSDALLIRARSFSESRAVCNVHWPSDIAEGRLIGAATVARLRAEADFRADLERARDELAAVRAQGLLPERDCAAEAAALGLQ